VLLSMEICSFRILGVVDVSTRVQAVKVCGRVLGVNFSQLEKCVFNYC
jgi:hypothetical protein